MNNTVAKCIETLALWREDIAVEKIEDIIRSYQTKNCDVKSYSFSMAEEIIAYLKAKKLISFTATN